MTPEVHRARWHLGAGVAVVVLGLGLMIAGFALTDADADRARLRLKADDLQLQLHLQLDATRVEYNARQCFVAIARGDYDGLLRELGWQRGGAR